MLKAKLLALCICPVVGSGAVTLSVPQVRSVVHKATAPRAKAAPKTRVRPTVQPAPTPVCAEPIAALSVPPISFVPTGDIESFRPPETTKSPSGTWTGSPGRVPSLIVPPAVAPPSPPLAALPEPATWAFMITGFGLVGSALRISNGKPAHV